MSIPRDDYKLAKEGFVTGHNGSTLAHITIISLTALSSIVLYSTLRSRVVGFPVGSTWSSFTIQVVFLVLPLMVAVTIAGDQPGWLALLWNMLLIIPALYLYLTREHKSIAQWQSLPDKAQELATNHSPSQKPVIPQLPAVTTWRAHMMIMTILCILAVDFPVFPRSLAKCESYGVSLMDLGVGSFVFSQGVVSALPMLKNANYLSSPTFKKLVRTTQKAAPVLLLGLIRVLLVKGSDYPEHTSEYGTHWNFFLTLALLPPLEVMLHPLIQHLSIPFIALSISTFHQVLLSRFGLAAWVAKVPRSNLLTHNKEGIVSIPGYLALHLLGLSVGTIVFPPTPSYFRRHKKSKSQASHQDVDFKQERSVQERQEGKTAIELCSYLVVYTVIFYCAKLFDWGEDVSRQLANFQYVIWVASYNIVFLLSYMIHDMVFFPSPFPRRRATDTAPQQGPTAVSTPHSSLESPTTPISSPFLSAEGALTIARRPSSRSSSRRPSYEIHGHDLSTKAGSAHNNTDVRKPSLDVYPILKKSPPELLDAVNRNSLALFLLANLATGTINLSMQTMFASTKLSLLVLTIYLSAVCLAGWFARNNRLITL